MKAHTKRYWCPNSCSCGSIFGI